MSRAIFSLSILSFLLLASMNGSHVEGVAENELDVFILAKISQPVLGKHALGTHDQVVAVVLNGMQELARLSPHVAMQSLVSSWSKMHRYIRLLCRSTPTIELVLTVVESHHGPPRALKVQWTRRNTEKG